MSKKVIKLLFLFFLIILTQKFYISAQLDPLQKYPKDEGCPMVLKTCITPPTNLIDVGSFGRINNNTGTTQFQILNTNIIIPKGFYDFYLNTNIFFPSLADPKTLIIELIPTINDTQIKIAIQLSKNKYNQYTNSMIIRSCAAISNQFQSVTSLQLDLQQLFDKKADFFIHLDQRAGILWPDTNMDDPKYRYFNAAIKNIKDIRNICNFHIAEWTLDLSIDADYTIKIDNINMLLKYPVMRTTLGLSPTEALKEAGQIAKFGPCEIKSFNYKISGKQLSAAGMLQTFGEGPCKIPQTSGDSGQSTTTTN